MEDSKPKLRIRGRVIDGSNVGVASAKIEVRAWSGKESEIQSQTVTVTADLGGAFEVAVDRDRATIGFGIATMAKGFVEGWKSVRLTEYDETRGVDVVVEGARTITGRVIDGDGRPIAGTIVQLWYGSRTTWPTDVDAEGRFRTPPHAPRKEFDLVVEPPGFGRRSLHLAATADDATDVGDIVFRKGGRVNGVVVDRHGDPVQDLWLEAQIVTGKSGAKPRVRTDTSGRFQFDDLSTEKLTIFVDGQGGPADRRRDYSGVLSDVEVGRADLRLVAAASTTIWLKFVDPDTRKPVDLQKAEYGLRIEGTPEPERLGNGASGSDPLVATSLSAESGRRYDLTVRAAGFEDGHVNGIDVGEVAEATVDVPMRRKP